MDKRRFKLLVFLTLAMVFLASGAGFATLLPVVNPSFEADVPPFPIVAPWAQGAEGQWSYGSISGWNINNGNGGTFWPTAVPYPFGTFTPAVAWSNGSITSQGLITNVTANTVYTLTAFVGQRFDTQGLGFPWPGYAVQLLAGAGVIAQDVNSFVPDPGFFLQSIVQYTALPGDPNIGLPLAINLVGPGIQVNFDMVTLDATPVPLPGALVLLGTGLVGLRLLGWRRGKA